MFTVECILLCLCYLSCGVCYANQKKLKQAVANKNSVYQSSAFFSTSCRASFGAAATSPTVLAAAAAASPTAFSPSLQMVFWLWLVLDGLTKLSLLPDLREIRMIISTWLGLVYCSCVKVKADFFVQLNLIREYSQRDLLLKKRHAHLDILPERHLEGRKRGERGHREERGKRRQSGQLNDWHDLTRSLSLGLW